MIFERFRKLQKSHNYARALLAAARDALSFHERSLEKETLGCHARKEGFRTGIDSLIESIKTEDASVAELTAEKGKTQIDLQKLEALLK